MTPQHGAHYPLDEDLRPRPRPYRPRPLLDAGPSLRREKRQERTRRAYVTPRRRHGMALARWAMAALALATAAAYLWALRP